MKKRLLSMLMAVLMIASLVPATALVASADCDHADTFSYSIEKNAAAKQPGITVEVCNVCGDVAKDVVVPFAEAKDIAKCAAAGHEWKTVELQKASCDKVGVKLTYCANCGTEKAPIVPDTSALGEHDYEFTVVVKPTCNKDGWGYAVCKNCKHIEFVANADKALRLLPNDAANTVILAVHAKFAATNEEHQYTDLKAVTEKTIVKDKNGKDVVLMPKTAPTHSLTVSGMAVVDKDTGKVDVVDADQNTMNQYNFVMKMNSMTDKRDIDVYGVKNALDPDDTNVYHGLGYEGSLICPDCGYFKQNGILTGLNDTKANPKHVMTLKSLGYYPYVDASGARHDGVTDVWYCEVCGYIGGEKLAYADYVDYNEYAVKGDTKVVGAKAADCQNPGATGNKFLYNGDEWVLTDKSEEITVKHHFVPAVGKAPTCTEDGYSYDNYYVCDNVLLNGKVCGVGKGNETQIITKAKGHTEAVKVLVAPTCSSEGMSVKYCSVCNEYLLKDNGEPAYYIIKAVPHTAGDPVNAKEATCTEVGYTGDKVCKWCGIMLEKGKEIPMKEHTVVDVAAVEATCTADGMTAGTKCSVCGTVLSGCEVVKALGHDYKDGKCTRCGEKDPNYVAPEFKDAASIRDYAKDAVAWAAKEGIVKGDENGNFLPTADITRQDFVTMLWRLKGSVASEKALTFGDKADIKDYAQTAVAWAVENGYINGRDNGNFDPAAKITRAEIVAILNRIAENAKAEKAADFTDIATHWAKDAIAWAAEAGIVNGVGNNMFAPNDNASRQDTVVMLYKFVNLK